MVKGREKSEECLHTPPLVLLVSMIFVETRDKRENIWAKETRGGRLEKND